jgi:diguanylate cyclase (GGDEF)-like protein
MLDTDYTNTPVIFFKDSEINEFYNHNLLLGPFNTDEESFPAIVSIGLKYKEIYTLYKEAEDKISSLEDNCSDKNGGFYKFSHFSTQVIQEFKKAKRFKHPLSLVIIEINSEKELKEEYPDKIVKKFMTSIVNSIKNSIRETDIPMSYDENKILILMPLTDEENVKLAINRLRNNINNTIYKDNGLTIKASSKIGYATMNEQTSKFSEMVKKAMKDIN